MSVKNTATIQQTNINGKLHLVTVALIQAIKSHATLDYVHSDTVFMVFHCPIKAKEFINHLPSGMNYEVINLPVQDEKVNMAA